MTELPLFTISIHADDDAVALPHLEGLVAGDRRAGLQLLHFDEPDALERLRRLALLASEGVSWSRPDCPLCLVTPDEISAGGNMEGNG